MIAEKLEAVARGEIKRLRIHMPPRHGKECADSTPVLTTAGWTTHGALKPGDCVFGVDGRPTKVLAVAQPNMAKVAVVFSNGERIKVHPNHEWTVFDRTSHKWRTMETRQLMRRALRLGPDGKRGGRYTFQVPTPSAVEFPEQALPLDAYALGVWLGDGATETGRIDMAAGDREVWERVAASGLPISSETAHPATGVVRVHFGTGKPGTFGPLTAKLDALGVLHAKAIPEVYLRGSVAQRLSLLAGLMDTDGCTEKETGRCRIVTTNEAVRDGIVDLCTTLGFRPCVSKQDPVLSSSGIQGRKVCYTVGFQPTMPIPVSLERRRCTRFAHQRRVSIVAIEPADNEPGRCIEVDADDGLYLVGHNLIPTHNSELASKRFPAWFMGNQPRRHIIAASYNSDLASDFGREVRNIVASRRYQSVFDTALSEDSSAANRWHTNAGGMYAAVGIGTATTGRGAHVLLIDDPFRDRQEADSERHREKVWRWYTSTAYTRLESDIRRGDVTEDDELWRDLLDDIESGDAQPFEGAIVGICTRWHEDDWAGRVEAAEVHGGEKWEVLDLPAIRDDGRPLWPAKYPLPMLERIRETIGERDWSALYQQRPTPDEGAYFKREWFRHYDAMPTNLRTYGASDYAVTAKGGDYTVHVVAGVDPDDNIYIIDVWRSQAETHHWVDAYIDLIARWKPLMWAQESGQIIKSLGPFIDRRMRERRVYCAQEQMTSVADKPTRARSFQARAAMGKVYLPHNAPWVADLMGELLTFPAGRHDDQVDALGLIGRMVDKMVGGRAPRVEATPTDKWRRAFARRAEADNSSNDWKTA